jgi:1,4-dihydroxy-2-naphthoyl-CoA hydrolase
VASAIWRVDGLTTERINIFSKGTMVENCGIEITEIGDDYLVATMPVTSNTSQPLGLLHGGASVVLAESVGSIASNLCLDQKDGLAAVGQSINASHLRPVPLGESVTARAKILHLGRKTHLWEIKIYNAENKLACLCQLTNAIIKRP